MKHTRKQTRKRQRRKGGAGASAGVSSMPPIVAERIDALRQQLHGKMNETNIEFLVSTFSMVQGYHYDKRQELMSDFIQECIGAYKQEYERKELLSFFDYSGANSLFKRVEQGLSLRYFSEVLNKVWKFTVVDPPEMDPSPEDPAPEPLTPEEKVHLFRCMLYKLYERALQLNRIVSRPKKVDRFTLWRGVKGGNLIELEELTRKGQLYTFNYLVSAAFKMEGALSFTSQRSGEKRVVCELVFEREIPGICISADLESEVLLGKGLTVRYEGEELLFVDGYEYTVKRFTYVGIKDTDDPVKFGDTLDRISDDVLRPLYREEGDSQTPSQRDQYFGRQLEEDLQDCLVHSRKDRGRHPNLIRRNAMPGASQETSHSVKEPLSNRSRKSKKPRK